MMELEEIVVTATRIPTPAMKVPALTYVIGMRDVQQLEQYRTLPQVLGEVPGVMVQKTSYGQGSPFVRGYTGFRNVLLVDGIALPVAYIFLKECYDAVRKGSIISRSTNHRHTTTWRFKENPIGFSFFFTLYAAVGLALVWLSVWWTWKVLFTES